MNSPDSSSTARSCGRALAAHPDLRPHRDRCCPSRKYPEVCTPRGGAAVPRAIQGDRGSVATPLEESSTASWACSSCSQATADGSLSHTVTFRLGTDTAQGAADRPEPRHAGRAAAARGGAPDRRHNRQGRHGHHDGRAPVSTNVRYDITYLRNYAVLNVKDRLRASRAGPGPALRRRRLNDARWLDPAWWPSAGLPRATLVRAFPGRT